MKPGDRSLPGFRDERRYPVHAANPVNQSVVGGLISASVAISLATEGVQIAEPLRGFRLSLACCGIEQQSCLVAAVGYTIAPQIQIRKYERRGHVLLADRFPKPLRCLTVIVISARSAIQVLLRHH